LNTKKEQYERVPEATQLLVLPFLAAVSGLLDNRASGAGYRVTLHRTMCRGDQIYLQQVVNYFSSDAGKIRGSGRIFPVDTGIIGAAFQSRKLHRTSKFKSDEALVEALKADLQSTNDSTILDDVAYSYFALPFLEAAGRDEQQDADGDRFPIIILFAECFRQNIFSDDALAAELCVMCTHYAATLDRLADSPLERVRNFPFSINEGKTVLANGRPFPKLNGIPDSDDKYKPPLLKVLKSLNFDFVA
jgi:hypothetical protein